MVKEGARDGGGSRDTFWRSMGNGSEPRKQTSVKWFVHVHEWGAWYVDRIHIPVCISI